jgi:hypothetical protein
MHMACISYGISLKPLVLGDGTEFMSRIEESKQRACVRRGWSLNHIVK